MRQIIFIAAICFCSIIVKAQPLILNDSSEVFTNGALDSFGFFRFYNKNLLFDEIGGKIEKRIQGDFYFYKEGVINESKIYLVYSYSEYTFLNPNLFSEKLSKSQIQKSLEEKELLSKEDLISKKRYIVEPIFFKQISKLPDSIFITKYIGKNGVVVNIKNDKELFAVILRLLIMNIPVGIADFTGDVIIPTKEISYHQW